MERREQILRSWASAVVRCFHTSVSTTGTENYHKTWYAVLRNCFSSYFTVGTLSHKRNHEGHNCLVTDPGVSVRWLGERMNQCNSRNWNGFSFFIVWNVSRVNSSSPFWCEKKRHKWTKTHIHVKTNNKLVMFVAIATVHRLMPLRHSC